MSMEDMRYWSWNRISDDGLWRLTSISVYEDKIYESWEKVANFKQTKANATRSKQRRGSQMPGGWLKHAKELLKCAQGATLIPRKMVNKHQAGKIPKST